MHNILEKLHRITMKHRDHSELYHIYENNVTGCRQELDTMIGDLARSSLAQLMDHSESLEFYASLDAFTAGIATGFVLAHELMAQMPEVGEPGQLNKRFHPAPRQRGVLALSRC